MEQEQKQENREDVGLSNICYTWETGYNPSGYRFEAAWKNPQRNRKYARYKNVHYPCGGCVPLFRYDVV